MLLIHTLQIKKKEDKLMQNKNANNALYQK